MTRKTDQKGMGPLPGLRPDGRRGGAVPGEPVVWQRRRVIEAAAFLLGTRLALVAAAYIAVSILPAAGRYIQANHVHNQPFSQPLWLEMWCRWDSEWYTQIAEQGYHLRQLEPQYPPTASLAYYPLYPLLLRAVSSVTGNTILAGLIVSTGACLVLLVVLAALVERELGRDAAGETTRFFLVYPASFFLTAVYPESLFLAVVVASFWYARQEKWLAAGAIAALAPAIKTQGLIFILPLAVEYWRQRRGAGRRMDWRAVCLLGPILGAIPYALYCRISWGHWLAYLDAQSAGWRGGIRWPISVYLEFLRSGQATAHQYAYSGYDFLLSIVFLVGLVPVFRRLPVCYGVYAACVVLLPLAGGLMSFNRYSLLAVPHFMVLPLLLKPPLARSVVACGLAVLLGATACVFALWGWVG